MKPEVLNADFWPRKKYIILAALYSSNVISVGGVCSKTNREASKVTKLISSIDEDESLV